MNDETVESIYHLASFPRSGNTWVRFLLANAYNMIEMKFPEIDFYNIHDIIPEHGLEKRFIFGDFPKIIKTHGSYKAAFRNSILLIRNPFDVLYSYFDFLNKNREVSISLNETIRHHTYGIRAVVKHTNSFTRNCENLLIVTYENLHANPGRELRKIFDLLQFSVPHHILADAVAKSSFLTMKNIETQKGRKYGNPDFTFTRSGKVNEGKQAISKEPELYLYMMTELKNSPLLYLLYS